MSYTSPRGGRRYFTASALDAQKAASPFNIRDAVANNLLHLADQAHSKVLVNDMAVESTILTGNAGPTADLASGVGSEWWTVEVYGPFDLSVFAYKGERIPYRVRCMIYADDAACAWAARLCLPDETTAMDGGLWIVDAVPEDVMLFPTAASATPTWIAPLSSDGMITPSRGLIDRARAGIRTLDGIGGSEAYVYTTSVCIKVLVQGTPGTLYGFHAQEFLVLP